MRYLSLGAIVATSVLMCVGLAATGQNQPASTPATPDNAASFLGDWTISATGSYGPVTMAVTLKSVEGKVIGEVSDANGTHSVTALSKSGTSVVLGYVFDYQGMPIDAVVTLTPNEKTVDAHLDFANGAAQFTGTAAKK